MRRGVLHVSPEPALCLRKFYSPSDLRKYRNTAMFQCVLKKIHGRLCYYSAITQVRTPAVVISCSPPLVWLHTAGLPGAICVDRHGGRHSENLIRRHAAHADLESLRGRDQER